MSQATPEKVRRRAKRKADREQRRRPQVEARDTRWGPKWKRRWTASRPAAENHDRTKHDRKRLRSFEPPAEDNERPRIIYDLIGAWGRFFFEPWLLPFVAFKRGRQRVTYSQLREGIVQLGQAFTYRMDILTLRVGRPLKANGKFQGIPLKDYLDQLPFRSRRSAERAVHVMEEAGLISTHEITVTYPNGARRASPAIRTISRKLFDALEIGLHLKRWRDQVSKDRRETDGDKEAHRGGMARVQMTAGPARGIVEQARAPPVHLRAPPRVTQEELERRKQEQQARINGLLQKGS
jgi:hypothetical protein